MSLRPEPERTRHKISTSLFHNRFFMHPDAKGCDKQLRLSQLFVANLSHGVRMCSEIEYAFFAWQPGLIFDLFYIFTSCNRQKNTPIISRSTPPETPMTKLLKRSEAAHFLRMSQSKLAHLVGDPSGPPYVKLGRSILYIEESLTAWIVSHESSSTGKKTRSRGNIKKASL